MKIVKLFVLAAASSVLTAACAGELASPERFERGFSAAGEADAGAENDGGQGNGDNGGSTGGGSSCDVPKLFATKCATAGCHAANAPAAKLDLASPLPGRRLLDAPPSAACSDYKLIDGTTPEKSLIYLKVTDTPQCGPRMPFGVPLSPAEQACILEWVNAL